MQIYLGTGLMRAESMHIYVMSALLEAESMHFYLGTCLPPLPACFLAKVLPRMIWSKVALVSAWG